MARHERRTVPADGSSARASAGAPGNGHSVSKAMHIEQVFSVAIGHAAACPAVGLAEHIVSKNKD